MSEIDDEDRDLFRQAVGPVHKLGKDTVPHHQAAPAPRLRQPEMSLHHMVEQTLTDPTQDPELQPGDVLSFARPGVSRQTMRRLRRGQYRIDAELDLHGLSLKDARQALLEFIRHNRGNNLTCVRVIHGKGWKSGNTGPVLKPGVNHWLRQLDEILAFVSARPVDGGTGAVYVLVRSNST